MKTPLCPLNSADAQTCPVGVHLTAGEFAQLKAVDAVYLAPPENKWLAGPGALVVVGVSHA